MRTKLAWFLGLLSAVNGVFMMMAPAAWYPIFPGVVQSGPFNGHFIRDIGAAFLVAGVGFCLVRERLAGAARGPGGSRLFCSSRLVHVGDAIAGRESLYHAALDAPTVYLSAVIAIWIAWPQSISKEDYPMLKWLLRRRMEAFEKEYDYDLSYAREILDISTRAAFKLGRVMGFGNYREDVPRDASFAAGLAGTMAEDCGPCTQLVVTMAEREGVAPATIKGDPGG